MKFCTENDIAKLITDEQIASTITSSPDIYIAPCQLHAHITTDSKKGKDRKGKYLIKTLHCIRRRNTRR